MIRFKTIEPETAAKTTAPQAEAPRPTAVPYEPPLADSGAAAAKPKGLARKTPLRARKPDAAPLFDDKASAAGSETGS